MRFPRGRPGCRSTALCSSALAPTVSLQRRVNTTIGLYIKCVYLKQYTNLQSPTVRLLVGGSKAQRPSCFSYNERSGKSSGVMGSPPHISAGLPAQGTVHAPSKPSKPALGLKELAQTMGRFSYHHFRMDLIILGHTTCIPINQPCQMITKLITSVDTKLDSHIWIHERRSREKAETLIWPSEIKIPIN